MYIDFLPYLLSGQFLQGQILSIFGKKRFSCWWHCTIGWVDIGTVAKVSLNVVVYLKKEGKIT
jgi:hypothetical protein